MVFEENWTVVRYFKQHSNKMWKKSIEWIGADDPSLGETPTKGQKRDN